MLKTLRHMKQTSFSVELSNLETHDMISVRRCEQPWILEDNAYSLEQPSFSLVDPRAHQPDLGE